MIRKIKCQVWVKNWNKCLWRSWFRKQTLMTYDWILLDNWEKHMVLISWYLGLSLLFWIWSEWTRRKAEKNRQGPASLEHAPFTWHHTGHFGFISHHLTKLWWGGHHPLHLGHEGIEAKEIKKFAQGKWQSPGLKPDLPNTRGSAFCPSSRIFQPRVVMEGSESQTRGGMCLVHIYSNAEMPVGPTFSQCPLEGCLASHCCPGGEKGLTSRVPHWANNNCLVILL